MPSPSLHLRVSHGDPRGALYPVLIGRLDGRTPCDFELSLDRVFAGKLSRRKADISVLLSDTPPGGAVLVALGDPSVLTEATLAGRVQAAVQAFLERLEEVPVLARPAGLTAALPHVEILGPRAVTRALIEGVRAAIGSSADVRIEALEIVALREEDAVAALGEILGLAGPTTSGLTADSRVRRLMDHRATAAPTDVTRWREARVVFTGTNVSWELLTGRARVDHGVAVNVGDAVRALLATRPDDDAAQALWGQLVPPELRTALHHGGDLVLRLDPAAAAIPWEDIYLRVARGAPGLVRQLVSPAGGAARPSASGRDVLVIADPLVEGMGTPAARAEADALLTSLTASGFRCTALVGGDNPPTVHDILRALGSKPWKIFHYAGHGASGRVLGTTGRRTSLMTAAPSATGATAFRILAEHINGLNPVPDLVFLNCCSAGAILPDPGAGPGVASSIAEQLIAIGVRMVVAAAWVINDELATVFAKAFYRELLEGRPFGEAVRAARQHCRAACAPDDDETWAAYQCYGDPRQRLEVEVPARVYVASQAVELLRSRGAAASDLALAGDASLPAALDELESAIPDVLREGGAVAEALGKVHQRCRSLERASEWLRRALRTPVDGTHLSTVKRLVDCQLALATDALLASGRGRHSTRASKNRSVEPIHPGFADAEARMNGAARNAELLVELCGGPVAFALRAAVARRRAWLCAKGESRRKLLVQSRKDYASAAQFDNDPYPALGEALLGVLLGDTDNLEAKLAAIHLRVTARMEQRPHFWVRAAEARLQLVALLGGLRSGPLTAYTALLDLGPSVWEIALLRDELWSLQDVGPAASRSAVDALASDVRAIVLKRHPGARPLFTRDGGVHTT